MAQKIPVTMAEAGMTLHAPAARPDGMVLVGADAVLTESSIDRLKAAGITMLHVKGNPLPHLGGGETLAKVQNRLDHIFRRFKNDRFMWALRNAIDSYVNIKKAEELAAQAAERAIQEQA